MGARLSQPRGPAGTTESSVPASAPPPPTPKNPFPRRFNSRTLIAPAAAATMALILFVYARTSIRAAKNNAQRHRNADGSGDGINLLAETRRRHGQAEKLEGGGGTIAELGRELFGGSSKAANEDQKAAGAGVEAVRSEEEKKLLAMRGKS